MPEIYFPNMNIQIGHLDRVAFRLFGLEVYWYGVIITLGIIGGLSLALYLAKKTEQDTELYMDFLMYNLLFAFAGARIYYVIFEIEYYIQNPMEILDLRQGGLAIYGAIIASAITAIVFTRIKKINFFQFADTAVLGLILGQAIGRWGNFVNREAFGDYTESFFAMRLMKEQVTAPVTEKILSNLKIVEGITYIQVHPTFLYESLWNIALLMILFIYYKHKRFEGEIMFLYFIGYGIGRLWIEGLRTDPLLLAFLKIPVSQIVSVSIIIGGVIGVTYGKKWRKI
ncbi:MAG TPA: prolipoprotein diacylglyceryl transferase [Clostridiales bacterium]|nr:prolipoprotein diacylglyceryl transferase [Clostridiales bacterium]